MHLLTRDQSARLRMNAGAGMASHPLLHLEEEQRSRLSCVVHASLASAQNAELLQYKETTTHDSSSIKYRRYGSRLGGVKVRHKRQVLQDMARPLKHWLYKHRDNPYPTKTEKVLLALGSHMTLVQVSNWFANARRRLKNTVRQPDLSWALRIKLYNKYIQGNAERLSVCSDDTDSDGEDGQRGGLPNVQWVVIPKRGTGNGRGSSPSEPPASPPSKYKSSLLNRYLNDTLRHMMAGGKADGVALKRRSHSESFSSNECDRDAVSPATSTQSGSSSVPSCDHGSSSLLNVTTTPSAVALFSMESVSDHVTQEAPAYRKMWNYKYKRLICLICTNDKE
uniref:Mohawk homeobox b n=1 Tax=Hippocampus comes TaxID=109280 RepID=A0A3Q3DQJ2_HIPCM